MGKGNFAVQLLNHMDDLNGMRTMAAPTENAEALLEELRSASELMRSLAKAETVLSAPDRQKAGALSKNLETLYRSGRRSLSQS